MGRPRVLNVGEVELDLGRRELRRAGASVPVQPRVFDVLVHLVEHRDRVVTKTELLDTVWSGDTVVPDVLTTALHSLRRALGDDPKAPAYVRTVPRVGYQLIAPVTAGDDRDFPALEARHAAFVGRREETSLFEEMLAGKSPVQLLFVHGPPGIGKTTLLQELGYQCRRTRTEHVWLAGESAGPFPDSFMRALADALGCDARIERLRERLAAGPLVVFVDDVHLLEDVDEWMRQELWPSLPSGTRLVLAGRRAPSARWRCDPAWRDAARAIDLGPFTDAEARELLSKRGIDPSAADALARVTRRHPLALAIAADLGPDERHLHLLERSDVVDTLVDWFTDQIVDEARLRAFEVACLLDEVSERELAALDDPERASENARWLSTLSFVTQTAGAIRVHTLVRDAVVARLARVRPHRLADLIEAAHRHWKEEFARAPDPAAKLRITNLLIGLGRHHPMLRASYEASDGGPECNVQPASARELAMVPALVQAHEGEEAAAIARRWLAHPGTSVWSVRDDSDKAAGFLVMLRLAASDRAAAAAAEDPVTLGVLRYLAEPGVARPGDEVVIDRFLLARDDYQAPSAVTRLLHTVKNFMIVSHGTCSPSAKHFVSVYGDADVWDRLVRLVGLHRLHDYEATVGSRRYAVYHLSLHATPVDVWVSNLYQNIAGAIRSAS